MLQRLFANATPAHAHCDLYCGVYDPAQAKIEALSCLKTLQKYQDSDDDHFKTRAIIIKEQRAEEVKHHLMVLWADFFTKDHFEQFPNLHQLFWDGVHGAGDVKKSTRRRRRREAAQDDRRDRRHLLADREGQGDGRLPARLRHNERPWLFVVRARAVLFGSEQDDEGEDAQQHERDQAGAHTGHQLASRCRREPTTATQTTLRIPVRTDATSSEAPDLHDQLPTPVRSVTTAVVTPIIALGRRWRNRRMQDASERLERQAISLTARPAC